MTPRRRAIVGLLAAAVVLLTAAGGISYWRDRQIREALHAALTPVQITNCELQRFGSSHDGGYLMCGNLLTPSQAAYSYGIGGNDDWGCAVAGSLDIQLHQYDCFNTNAPSCGSTATQFHTECVGPAHATIDGRPFDTMANQVARNGDTGKRLIVKMDVEGSEWQALASAPDHTLEAIDQLVVEFHGVDDRAHLGTIDRLRQFFYVAHYHHNNFECRPGFEPFAGPVFEVLLVNKRIAVANPWVTTWGPSPLDAPNDPRRDDCQTEPQRSEADRLTRWLLRKVRGAAHMLQ